MIRLRSRYQAAMSTERAAWTRNRARHEWARAAVSTLTATPSRGSAVLAQYKVMTRDELGGGTRAPLH